MSKKLRNRFLALICLAVFIAVGVLFYVNWVVQKPFAIIVFLADNFSSPTLTAARIYEGGADHRLQVEKFPHLALLTTQANDFAVADEAAAASAIACGKKVNNYALALDISGNPLPSMLNIAKQYGRSVGIVSNEALTDPSAAAFYAKSSNALDSEGIAKQLVDQADVDVIFGGGEENFLPDFKGGIRKDGRDLVLEMRRKGYDIIKNKSELETTPVWRAPKLFGLFSKKDLAYTDEIQSAGPQPTLADLVKQSIQSLQYNRKGYLLIVDASLSGKAAQQNDGERTLREFLAFDHAVTTATTYAGKNSLIIVAGTQSTGGLRLNGYPFRNDKGVGIVGINAQGVPSLTWSTGPSYGAGAQQQQVASTPIPGMSPASAANSPSPLSPPTEPAAFKAPTAVGVAEDAIAVSAGPGSEQLQGFKDNTDVFYVVKGGL